MFLATRFTKGDNEEEKKLESLVSQPTDSLVCRETDSLKLSMERNLVLSSLSHCLVF